MTKHDVCFAVAVLIIASAFFLYNRFSEKNNGNYRAVIYADGEIVETVPLSEVTREIKVETERGYNKITVFPDGAAVTESDCPNGDCVRSGKITGPAQSIICLPHRLTVRLEAEWGVDAVAR